MFYFLTRQWYRISRYRFTSISANLADQEIRVTPELIAAYDDTSIIFTLHPDTYLLRREISLQKLGRRLALTMLRLYVECMADANR